MHFLKTSTLLAIVAASVPHLVSAAPAVAPPAVKKRAAEDILVFKFADVLEQLESAFYEQAIAKFQEADFVSAGFSSANLAVEQFVNIQKDESTHSVVLQAALKSFGEEPITSCKFNFAPALTDVATMAATARVVENVGVAAYLGGATLLTDPVLLTAAGSILTVEARHQTVLNILSGTGTAIPNAFDFALTPSEVLALAGPFFDGPCDLGVPANAALAVTNTGAIGPGTKLTFSSSAITDQPNLHCQMLVGGKATAIPFPINDCVVPSDINGPVAIFVTSDAQPLLNNVRDRATTQLVAGPALAFIDIQPQTIGQLARGSGVAATSTSTISPSQASGVVAGATGAGAPAPTGSAVVTLSASANLVTGPSQDGAITVNGWTIA
ncbi:ferritin-like domain-containing protein [Coprinopsis sp. MPI-PUGE-AT-0042]|nr:ferritin-like domain-containing protein [Coprinopsis sp. MPI-PUGE-AT-0042]